MSEPITGKVAAAIAGKVRPRASRPRKSQPLMASPPR